MGKLADDAQVPAKGTGFRGMALAHNVSSKEQVAALIEQAVSAGAKLIKQPEMVFWGGYSGYFADLDDRLWEIAWNPHAWIGPESLYRGCRSIRPESPKYLQCHRGARGRHGKNFVQPLSTLCTCTIIAMTLSGNTNDYYRIGSVASLTGIAVERLRAWERRYQFSPAYKDGKTRFYSKDQLEILKKIKSLIDQGQTISSVINLTEEQLDARSGSAQRAPQAQSLVGQSPRISLIGANLLQLEQRVSDNQRLDIVSRWANLDAFLGDQISPTSETYAPQVLVLQLPVLTEHAIKQAQQALPNTKIVTLYQFATANQISRCQEQHVSTLKWPLSWAEIEYTCINEFGLPRLYGVSAPRRFSDEELIAIAAEDQDPNQCAQHLVEQIHQLNALTDYLQTCAGEEEVREGGGKREALKALAQTRTETAQARAQLETALDTLLTAAYKQLAAAPAQSQSIRPDGFSTH